MSLTHKKDDDKVFIPTDIDEFVKALQDPGKRNENTKDKLLEHKELDKFCKNIAKMWKNNNFKNFSKNPTHAKKAILKLLYLLGKERALMLLMY